MTIDVDILNRALQLIGTRTTVTSFAEASNEAIQGSLAYPAVQDWCLGAANWNFARAVSSLVVSKSAGPPVSSWNGATQPLPPWLFEYTIPANFLRAIYVTDSAHVTTANFDGNLQRFTVGSNSSGAQVILTNASPAILVYTVRVIDPNLWPWYFERFMVATLALTLCQALSGEKIMAKNLSEMMMRFFQVAESVNREQGLEFEDSTPEWVQAMGIQYPALRDDNRQRRSAPRAQRRQQAEPDDQ